jgi:hypothetical protein
MRLEDVTPAAVGAFQARLAKRENQVLMVRHGVSSRARKVWGLRVNPVAEVERHPLRASGDIEVYSPEEVWALARAAADE